MTHGTTHKDIYEVSGAVVVGVDGSESSSQALEWAADQARLAGRRLVAITTWDWPPSYDAFAGWPSDVDFAREAEKILQNSVEKTLEAGAARRVTRKVIHGRPARVLVDASNDAALIVVGSRGHGEFSGMLLGSVSEFLATHAHCPVVIVRHAHEGN